MQTIKLDLHVHSESSPDGSLPIAEIVRVARSRGLSGVAICDHDIVHDGLPAFDDFLLIPGTEVSTDRGHLLGLFVTRPIQSRRLEEAVREIHAQGGIAVFAHPFEHSTDEARLDDVAALADGIEVWNARAGRKNRHANAMARRLCERYARSPFAGSDAHVAEEIGNGVTQLIVSDAELSSIRTALLEGRQTCGGVDSPARYTAKSQLVKRRKEGAGLPSYCKWALFAGKCLLADLIRKV